VAIPSRFPPLRRRARICGSRRLVLVTRSSASRELQFSFVLICSKSVEMPHGDSSEIACTRSPGTQGGVLLYRIVGGVSESAEMPVYCSAMISCRSVEKRRWTSSEELGMGCKDTTTRLLMYPKPPITLPPEAETSCKDSRVSAAGSDRLMIPYCCLVDERENRTHRLFLRARYCRAFAEAEVIFSLLFDVWVPVE